MLPLNLKRKLLNKAKRMSPEDTGNLRFNAIKGLRWTNPTKFTIRYDEGSADYIVYLQEKEFAGGSTNIRNRHKGFIDRTVLDLTNDLISYFSGKKLKGSDYGFGKDDKGKDLYSLDRRTKVYERSIKLNELKREVNADDSSRSVETININ